MKSTALFAVLLLSAGSALAQSSPTKLNLQQAVQLAVDKNPDLQKIRQNVNLAKADYLRAIGAFLPSVGASLGATYSNGSQYIAPTLPVQNSENRSYRWGFNANMNLFNGLSDLKGFTSSEYNLETAKLQFGRSVQTTVLDVTSNFLLALQRQELLKIAAEDLSYQEEQLKKITEMTRLGSRPMVDLYNQQYAKANAELNLINAQKNFEIAKSDLVALLSLDPTSEYDIEAPVLEGIKTDEQFSSLVPLLSSALNQRPDYQAAKIGLKSRENAVWQAWANYGPSLDLSWNWGANAASPTSSGIKVPTQLSDQRAYSVSLTLSVPIFDRFQTNYMIEQATVNLQNSQYDLEKMEKTIQIGVKQAWLDYKSYKKAYDASEAQFKAASLLKETAQERYNVGAGSYLELANATKDFVTAASNLTTSKYQFEFQKKVLEFYIGSLNPEDYVNIR